jgi:hypothetical protein
LGLYDGFVLWLCHLGLYDGFVLWLCHLGLYDGFVLWSCHMGLYDGFVLWLCSMGLYDGFVIWVLYEGYERGYYLHATFILFYVLANLGFIIPFNFIKEENPTNNLAKTLEKPSFYGCSELSGILRNKYLNKSHKTPL